MLSIIDEKEIDERDAYNGIITKLILFFFLSFIHARNTHYMYTVNTTNQRFLVNRHPPCTIVGAFREFSPSDYPVITRGTHCTRGIRLRTDR